MATQLLLLGVLVGADNFVVSSALGGLALTRPQRRWLAAAFGLCEGAMPWLGSAFLVSPNVSGPARLPALGPWCLLASGVLSLLGACHAGRALAQASPSLIAASTSSAGAHSRWLALDGRLGWLALLLPPALSLDNLAAGAGAHQLGAGPLATALIIGSVSASLSGLGLILGDRVVLRWRVPRALWVGGGLVAYGLIVLAI